VRYRAIGCGYTWPARRLNAVVIAKAYGTTVTVAFVSATGMSDRAYEEPTTERTQTMGKTKDVRAAVEDELIFDPLVDSTDIRVANLSGDVALNGTVPSYDSDVAVDTKVNTVTLTGHVRSWAEHDAVLDAAWIAPAVYDADDQLVVTG
jgi:osmotically-inducible protein OsmY